MIDPVSGGLIGEMLKNLNIQGLNTQPKIENGVLKIELNEDQVKQIAFKGIDQSKLQYMDLKLEQGKMILTIKLF